MSKNFFDHLNQVTKVQDKNYWKTLDEPSRKSWNTYMMLRYLSMNPDWIDTVDILQQYCHSLEDEHVYKLLISYIPKGNRFIRYIKRDKGDDDVNNIVKVLCKYYECSKREAKDIYKILNQETISNIIETVGGDIETKKLRLKKKKK